MSFLRTCKLHFWGISYHFWISPLTRDWTYWTLLYLLLAASVGRWHQARACHNSVGSRGRREALRNRGRFGRESVRWPLLVWTAKNRLVPDPLHPFPERIWDCILLLDSCKCNQTPQNYWRTKIEGLLQLLFSLFDRLPTVSTPASWTTSPSLCRGSLWGNLQTFCLATHPISNSPRAINVSQTHDVSLAGPSSSSSAATAPCLCTPLSRRCVPLYFPWVIDYRLGIVAIRNMVWTIFLVCKDGNLLQEGDLRWARAAEPRGLGAEGQEEESAQEQWQWQHWRGRIGIGTSICEARTDETSCRSWRRQCRWQREWSQCGRATGQGPEALNAVANARQSVRRCSVSVREPYVVWLFSQMVQCDTPMMICVLFWINFELEACYGVGSFL